MGALSGGLRPNPVVTHYVAAGADWFVFQRPYVSVKWLAVGGVEWYRVKFRPPLFTFSSKIEWAHTHNAQPWPI